MRPCPRGGPASCYRVRNRKPISSARVTVGFAPYTSRTGAFRVAEKRESCFVRTAIVSTESRVRFFLQSSETDRFLPTTGPPRNQFTTYFRRSRRRRPRATHTHTHSVYLNTRRYSLWWPSPPAAAATRPFRYRLHMGGLNYSINGPTSKGRGYTACARACVFVRENKQYINHIYYYKRTCVCVCVYPGRWRQCGDDGL